MTACHAIHESPYDDACPDCAGYSTEDTPAPARGCLLGLLLSLPIWVAVIGTALYLEARL